MTQRVACAGTAVSVTGTISSGIAWTREASNTTNTIVECAKTAVTFVRELMTKSAPELLHRKYPCRRLLQNSASARDFYGTVPRSLGRPRPGSRPSPENLSTFFQKAARAATKGRSTMGRIASVSMAGNRVTPHGLNDWLPNRWSHRKTIANRGPRDS